MPQCRGKCICQTFWENFFVVKNFVKFSERRVFFIFKKFFLRNIFCGFQTWWYLPGSTPNVTISSNDNEGMFFRNIFSKISKYLFIQCLTYKNIKTIYKKRILKSFTHYYQKLEKRKCGKKNQKFEKIKRLKRLKKIEKRIRKWVIFKFWKLFFI